MKKLILHNRFIIVIEDNEPYLIYKTTSGFIARLWPGEPRTYMYGHTETIYHNKKKYYYFTSFRDNDPFYLIYANRLDKIFI